MSNIKFQKTQLVELQVGLSALSQQRYGFIDQPQLRSEMAGTIVLIDAIEAYNSDDMTNSPVTGRAIITPAIMKKAGITLYVGNPKTGVANKGEYINFCPLISMHRVDSGTNPYVRDLFIVPELGVDWSKSYVSVAPAIGGSTEYSFLFNVYYHYADALNKNNGLTTR